MKPLLAFLMLLLWATSAQAAGLLTGATAASYTIPSGWTLVTVDGFESGAIDPAKEYMSGSITTSIAHTGTRAMGGAITGDGQAIRIGSKQGIHTSREIYLSFWEYLTPTGSFNDEMFAVLLRMQPNASTVQQIYWDWYPPFQFASAYNSPAGSLMAVTEGIGPGQIHQAFYNTIYAPSVAPQLGQWAQFEVHIKTNTPGLSDGVYEGYIDGVQRINMQNVNINGGIDMRGMTVQAGGTYTRHVWRSVVPAPNYGTCSATMTGQSIDQTPSDPTDAAMYRCIDFNNCSCPPNTPIFSRYFDDFIVMVPTGGAPPPTGDTTPPTIPTSLTVQ